jgi:transcription antitermination factor NusG
MEALRDEHKRGLGADCGIADIDTGRKWYAVFTYPKHEKSVSRHLAQRDVESFLPTYEDTRVWKNRQRMKVILPLFPSYLFIRIGNAERIKALQSPGVIQIVGNSQGPLALPTSEIEFLRSALVGRKVEPFRELVVGQRVCIKTGVMQGVQGTLVRKSKSMRFVLTLELINQHASIEIDAEDLMPIAC